MTSFTAISVPSPMVEKQAIRDLMQGHLRVINGRNWKLGLDDILAHVEHKTMGIVRLQFDKDSGTLWADVNEMAYHVTDHYATRQKKVAAYDRMSFTAIKSGIYIHDVGLNFFKCYPLVDKTTPESRNFSFTLEVEPIHKHISERGVILEITGSFINIKNEQLLFSDCTFHMTDTTYYIAKNGKMNRVKQERKTIKTNIEVY